MYRQAVFGAIGCVVLLLAASESALALEFAGQFRLGVQGGIALSEQEDLNDTIDDVEEFWSSWDISEFHWHDSELRGSPLVGVSLEYLLSENWIVGADFTRLSDSGGFDWYGEDMPFEEGVGSADVDAGYDVSGNIAFVYAAHRLPLGDSPIALRLGAGVGYVFGAKLESGLSGYLELDERTGSRADTTILHQLSFEATGSAFALQGFVGVEYELTGKVLLSSDIGYRVASVSELELDDVRSTVNGLPVEPPGDMEEGHVLRWRGTWFSTREGDKVGLSFSGVHFTLRVAYVF